MQLTATALAGVWHVATTPQPDERGSFTRLLCTQTYAQHGIAFAPQQISSAYNRQRYTLRGMHWQTAHAPEIKVVLCVRGQIYDVVADMRPQSPTYRQHVGFTLQAGQGLIVPPLCAHGYLTLKPHSTLLYAMQGVHTPSAATGARWNDPALAIAWPHPPAVIAPRDANFTLL